MEPGVDHLDTAEARARFLVDGDAAGVIHDLDGAVLMEGYRDAVAETGEGLVNGVVDDLPQAVHQATGVRGSDIHGRAFAHRLEALQDQQVLGSVVAGGVGVGVRTHRDRLPGSKQPRQQEVRRLLRPEEGNVGGTRYVRNGTEVIRKGRASMTNTATEQATGSLTAMDRCDRCGAQAYLRVELSSGGELLFCAHHANKHREKLAQVAARIHDETARLKE